MTHLDLARYAGWAAYFSAAATILGIATLIAFFTLGEPFGTLNDILSILIALSMMVILFELDRRHRPVAPVVSLVVLIACVIALLVAAVFQALLIFKVIDFAQTAMIVPLAFGVFGAALMTYSYLSLAHGFLPGALAVLGLIAGAGYLLVITGFILDPQGAHILTTVGGLITVVGYPAWAIWFGRLLLSGRVGT